MHEICFSCFSRNLLHPMDDLHRQNWLKYIFLCTGSCFEVKTEADSNDISAECSHDDNWPTVVMFGLSDAHVFSAVICLSVC